MVSMGSNLMRCLLFGSRWAEFSGSERCGTGLTGERRF